MSMLATGVEGDCGCGLGRLGFTTTTGAAPVSGCVEGWEPECYTGGSSSGSGSGGVMTGAPTGGIVAAGGQLIPGLSNSTLVLGALGVLLAIVLLKSR